MICTKFSEQLCYRTPDSAGDFKNNKNERAYSISIKVSKTTD